MNTDQVGHIIAAASLNHPLHNKELQRHLVRAHGIATATEVLVAASGHAAFRRRFHLLTLRQAT